MFLRRNDIKKRFPVTSAEIDQYIREHRLKSSKTVIRKVTRIIRVAKIRSEPGRKFSISQAVAPWQIIYGKARVGGVLTFVNSRPPSTKTHLDLVFTIAGHKVTGIDRLWLDTDEVIFGGTPDPRWNVSFLGADGSVPWGDDINLPKNKVFMSSSLGDPDQEANSDLVGQVPTKWTADHRQRNCAHAYIILVWNSSIFPEGLPDVQFEVRGKPILDTRTSTTGYSNNAALVIADFLTDTKIGLGISWSQIDTTALNTAANICDENVTLADGSTEKRYTINGAFESTEDKSSVLEQMIAAMAGSVSFVGGKWKIRAGAYTSPVLTLTDDDWITPLRVQAKAPRNESFNAVRGTYVASDKNYEEREFPVVKNDYYQALDSGERVYEDLQLPFTTSSATAQRLAKIFLEDNRQSIILEGTAKLKALQAEVGETIQVTRARLGWTNKIFRVQELELTVEEDAMGAPILGVRLLLKETASAIWSWNNGEETTVDIAPNSDLPSLSSVQALTGLTLSSGTDELYIRSDGTVFTRIKVAWTETTDAYVLSGGYIEIQYKESSHGTFVYANTVPGDQSNAWILDVHDGVDYDVRIRAKNAAGNYSVWTTYAGYRVVGKTVAPSNVQGLIGSVDAIGVRLSWNPIADLDVAGYEVRYTNEGGSWESALILGDVRGTSFATGIKLNGTYVFMVKARDTSGNYSATASELRSVVPAPEAPTLTAVFESSDVVFSWTEPESYFPISHFEIRYGAISEAIPVPSFDDSILLVATKAQKYRLPAMWLGERWFWVTAIDIHGNIGAHYGVTLTVAKPGIPVITASDVIDNNVLVRWATPTSGSLPIRKFQFYRGDSFSSATLLGETSSTFVTHFESVSGTYTYWVCAVDSANNRGEATSVVLNVNEPPDFELVASGMLRPEEARIGRNVLIDGLGFVVGAGGPGGYGSPMGFLLAFTYARGSLARVAGVPIGLLAALTYGRSGTGGGVSGAGSPMGTLLAITKAS